jgi:hypothetical protein
VRVRTYGELRSNMRCDPPGVRLTCTAAGARFLTRGARSRASRPDMATGKARRDEGVERDEDGKSGTWIYLQDVRFRRRRRVWDGSKWCQCGLLTSATCGSFEKVEVGLTQRLKRSVGWILLSTLLLNPSQLHHTLFGTCYSTSLSAQPIGMTSNWSPSSWRDKPIAQVRHAVVAPATAQNHL